MKIVNLTPHDVVVRPGGDESTEEFRYPASGHVARVLSTPQEEIDRIEDGRVAVYSPQEPRGVALPCDDSEEIEAVLVSMMVAEALGHAGATDFDVETPMRGREVRVFVPDSGPESALRDERGAIVGVRRLVEYEPLDLATVRRRAPKAETKAAKKSRV
jgi:hypothetical protein